MSFLVTWAQLIAVAMLATLVVFSALLAFLLRFVAHVRAAKDNGRPAEGSGR
ncbi:hypothetical protein [Streptomyces millisiae]|uniref:Uncharacterized protein n=1 Tax=Streptomyces millisiae TaxID=3075542 RepID=A0ABU2LIJ5_9ACTN|nr:hypothetical protein [Streptomyces sp. DSM 44918]MDT0317409.1 hypothetical protein [Streptomyces sp. DSM 44918]